MAVFGSMMTHHDQPTLSFVLPRWKMEKWDLERDHVWSAYPWVDALNQLVYLLSERRELARLGDVEWMQDFQAWWESQPGVIRWVSSLAGWSVSRYVRSHLGHGRGTPSDTAWVWGTSSPAAPDGTTGFAVTYLGAVPYTYRAGIGGVVTRQWGVPGGRMLTDAVTRSPGGRVITATVSDSTRPSAPDAWTYTYGPAGRPTQAVLAAAGVRPSVSLGYLYAPTGGCGADPAAGKNGSCTGTTTQLGSGPVTSSSYCTDGASRLTAVTSTTGGLAIAAASIGYDTHGNATQLGTQTWTYDGADRVTGTSTYGISPTQTLTYGRDSLGRVVSRTASGPETSTARYGFTGTDDSPDLQLTAGNALSERYIGLPGGVLYTKGYAAAGTVWSLSNLHGDVTTTISGTTVSTGFVYDPYGQPLNPTTGVVDPTATPTTRTGGTTDAWHGTAQRGYEHTGGLNQMLMGARTYLPALGIFTATDPIEGGNTTTYTCPQDPINQSDLDGQATSDPIRLGFGGAIAVPAPAAPSGQGVLTAIVGVLVGIVSMVAGSSLGGDVVLQRTIPEPGSSDSAKSRKRAYRVYEIYYFNLGKVHTFKYGITGAANNARLRVGVRQCKAMGFSGCDSRIVLGDQTYAGARAIEYGLIKGYARRNGGWCPPGQWRSCK